MKKKKKEKNLKKEVRKAMIATTAATSLFVNNSYDNPLEIIDDTYSDGIMEAYEKDEKNPYKNKARYYLSLIPQPIRSILLLPLWCFGWLIMSIIRPLWTNILSGFSADIVQWIILLTAISAIIIISSIITFPALPIKKIFNKKTLSIITILLTILLLTDKVLQYTNNSYLKISSLIKLIGSISIIIIMLFYNYFKNRKIKIIASNNNYNFKN